MTEIEYNQILEDIYLERGNVEEIAARYNKHPTYVAKIRSKVLNLKYEPRIEDDRLVCYYCGSFDRPFHIHHSHLTNEWLAILCNKCNLRLENVAYFSPQPVDSRYTPEYIKKLEYKLKELIGAGSYLAKWGEYLEERIKELE